MTEIEKLYSEAFYDGVDYAQKMFAEEDAKKENIFKRGWNKLTNDIWEKGKDLREETTNDAGEKVKKLNWKRLGKRAGVVGGGTALVAVPTALAIRSHRKKKAAEAEAEKNYSEGFLDGVDYAQKMFAEEDAKKENIFKRGWNKLTNDIWEKGKDLREETTNDAGEKVKKLNWKRLGKRAGVVGGGTALVAVPTALAIRRHNKKKAEAEAEN